MKSDLKEYARRWKTTGIYSDGLEVDALIVGAGFSGIYMLYELRKLGLKSVIYEAGMDIGGTWRWNRYPGARVDSEVPMYEYSIPEVWKDWTWTTNYPNYEELRTYFDHVDKVLDIKKDCAFASVVINAQYYEDEGKWHIKTEDGRMAKCKYFIIAAGPAAKRYIPTFKGLEMFQGVVHHSAFWPEEGVDIRGKRVAVIGTGASGVQVIEEVAPQVKSLTVFQRTPNLALPMRRKLLTAEEQNNGKLHYSKLFGARERYFGGFCYGFSEKYTFDDSPEEQETFLQRLWDHGGFHFWLATYKDILFNPKANRIAYDFWAKSVGARIGDPAKREILAPIEPPHPWGVKRPCLEQNYYEQFNRSNVNVIDINKTPIKEFRRTGIILNDGMLHEFDVIAICTGFDITTGGMTNMGLRSIHGNSLQDEWKSAANTYLGITVSGYPNMFHLHGPHGPTLLSNGPTAIEIQGRLIADVIKKMEGQGIKSINPTVEATKSWKKRINELSDASLFSTTTSTFMGGNLPGKAFEQSNFAGGMAAYADEIRVALPDFKGFEVIKAKNKAV